MEKPPKSAKKFEFYIDNERPEETHGDPLLYYKEETFESYVNSKSLMRTQQKITQRALELLKLKPGSFILDLGMGCGFSTATLMKLGYGGIGIDIHRGMLSYYDTLEFNPIEADFKWLSFRPKIFDAAISISSVQWIFGIKNNKARKEAIKDFVKSLAFVLKDKGKVSIQFYPRSDDQMKELGAEFVDSGFFEGNFVIDNADAPRKRKIYLIANKI